MRVLGLSGGIATGKSLVSGSWRDKGVTVIDCDKIARQVLNKVKRLVLVVSLFFTRGRERGYKAARPLNFTTTMKSCSLRVPYLTLQSVTGYRDV